MTLKILNSNQTLTMVATIIGASFLTACAGGGAAYRPIIDTPSASANADLADCQALAEQRSYDNEDTRTGALVGAGLGALFYMLDPGPDDAEDALGAAALGAALGGGGAALETRSDRKSIVMNCMAGRGHRVVG